MPDIETRITLRLPEKLRDAMAGKAEASGRSMNAEILEALHSHVSGESEDLGRFIEKYEGAQRVVMALERALDAAEQAIERDTLELHVLRSQIRLAQHMMKRALVEGTLPDEIEVFFSIMSNQKVGEDIASNPEETDRLLTEFISALDAVLNHPIDKAEPPETDPTKPLKRTRKVDL